MRWVVIAFFVLSSTLNYLDRQLLAALAPAIRAEFDWSLEDYGRVISYFSAIYALCAPLAGLLIDRLGLNAGVSVAVGTWSLATLWTGWARDLASLVASRLLLGVAQAGGVPASGKAMSLYLEPRERALGNAFSQIGLSIGGAGATLLAGYMALHYDWRSAFLAAGAMGFLWIPLWFFVSRLAPVRPADPTRPRVAISGMLASPTYWGLVVATMLAMTVYSFWTNWTTPFLVREHGMAPDLANRTLAWIPPLVGGAGGIVGGIVSMRLVQASAQAAATRRRVALGAAAMAFLTTIFVPMAPSPLTAAVAIGISFFCSAALSVNLYALPMDIFGQARAGFGVASLTAAYGASQTIISPIIGRVADRHGFQPVCVAAAMLPLAGVALLYLTRENTASQ